LSKGLFSGGSTGSPRTEALKTLFPIMSNNYGTYKLHELFLMMNHKNFLFVCIRVFRGQKNR
jgi:hypothetical protein